jgi:hypothetical protein
MAIIGYHLGFSSSLGLGSISYTILTLEKPNVEPNIRVLACIQAELWSFEAYSHHIDCHHGFSSSFGLGSISIVVHISIVISIHTHTHKSVLRPFPMSE